MWESIGSVEELGEVRIPVPPFADRSFDLALCSHFLFLYTTQLGDTFHRLAVREMSRVATEVRIFPLLALGGGQSPCVQQVADECDRLGAQVSIEHVAYEFQRGGNQMMRIRPRR